MLWELGTNSVQLRERKNGFLVPKRHWMKHLDFLSFLLESRQSLGSWVRSPLPKVLMILLTFVHPHSGWVTV